MSTIEKALGRLRGTADEPKSVPRQPTNGAQGTHLDASVANNTRISIDARTLRKRGIHPPARLETTLRDEYRRIKRPLIANAFGRGVPKLESGNVIMVTSALAGEGKTFTSINLAMSIARDPEVSVILIDGDVARASASSIFGVQRERGLIDLLADQTLPPNSMLLPTSIDSLFFLPAGKKHIHSEELLSGSRMEQVVSAFAANKNTIVIFDSPPLLRTPEAVTLSTTAGQIVLVVKALSTAQHHIHDAIEQLDPNKAINLILNQSLSGPGGDEYGGYYGGSYGETDRK